jgi:hypothetical protein
MDKRSVPSGEHRGEERDLFRGHGVDDVLVAEVGQFLVRIEDVGILVRAEQSACLHRPAELGRFLAVEESGGKHGDLTFEHFGEVVDAHAAVRLDRHRVVGVVEPVRAAVLRIVASAWRINASRPATMSFAETCLFVGE